MREKRKISKKLYYEVQVEKQKLKDKLEDTEKALRFAFSQIQALQWELKELRGLRKMRGFIEGDVLERDREHIDQLFGKKKGKSKEEQTRAKRKCERIMTCLSGKPRRIWGEVVQGLGPQLALQLAQKQARKRGTTLDDLIARWEKERGKRKEQSIHR